MKIRNGFVSNSSSSSFIIGVEKGSKQDFLVSEIVDAMNSSYRCENSCELLNFKTKADVLKYFRYTWMWSSATDEEIMLEHGSWVDSIMEAINSDKLIYDISIDYNNDFAYALVNNNLKDCVLVDGN